MRRLLALDACHLPWSQPWAQSGRQPPRIVAEQAGKGEVIVQSEKVAVVGTLAGAIPMAIHPTDFSLCVIVSSTDARSPNILRFDSGRRFGLRSGRHRPGKGTQPLLNYTNVDAMAPGISGKRLVIEQSGGKADVGHAGRPKFQRDDVLSGTNEDLLRVMRGSRLILPVWICLPISLATHLLAFAIASFTRPRPTVYN